MTKTCEHCGEKHKKGNSSCPLCVHGLGIVKAVTNYRLVVDRGYITLKHRMKDEAKAYERLACYREDDTVDAWIEKQVTTEWIRTND